MELWDEELYQQLKQAVRKAGGMFSDRKKAAEIRKKGATDFVTQVDLSVQSFLKERLEQLAPQVQLMGEEQDNSGLDPDRPMWVLDPVDGTTNLVHDYCHSAVSLALVQAGQVELGLVHNPFAGELFSARRGGGAFLNGAPIRVSGARRLADSLVDVGTNPSDREHAGRNFQWMQEIFDRSHDVRRMGAASLCLCYVAAGRLDGYVEGGLKPWDYAAGMLIVREAGGFVSSPEGEEPSLLTGGGVVAGNGAVGPQLLELLKSLA